MSTPHRNRRARQSEGIPSTPDNHHLRADLEQQINELELEIADLQHAREQQGVLVKSQNSGLVENATRITSLEQDKKELKVQLAVSSREVQRLTNQLTRERGSHQAQLTEAETYQKVAEVARAKQTHLLSSAEERGEQLMVMAEARYSVLECSAAIGDEWIVGCVAELPFASVEDKVWAETDMMPCQMAEVIERHLMRMDVGQREEGLESVLGYVKQVINARPGSIGTGVYHSSLLVALFLRLPSASDVSRLLLVTLIKAFHDLSIQWTNAVIGRMLTETKRGNKADERLCNCLARIHDGAVHYALIQNVAEVYMGLCFKAFCDGMAKVDPAWSVHMGMIEDLLSTRKDASFDLTAHAVLHSLTDLTAVSQ